ncbi:MAG: hypothetical protein RL215_2635 [Planctomycetota bacterium]|jgi:hypothetical protein
MFLLTDGTSQYSERRQRTLQRRVIQAELPKKVPRQKTTRLFVRERGIAIRFTRVIDMINRRMHHGAAIVIQGSCSHFGPRSRPEVVCGPITCPNQTLALTSVLTCKSLKMRVMKSAFPAPVPSADSES